MIKILWIAILGLFLPMVLSQDVESDNDLCRDVKCKKPRGAWCQVVEVDGSPKATCVCPTTCPEEDKGGPVCSVFGKQYDSLCEFHKYACRKKKTIPLAFNKPCIASQKPCTKEEFIQFPHRLLEWFMHLKEKDEFGRIDPNRRITLVDNDKREQVAMWKFDDLDRNRDDTLDKAELLKFRYSLMPLEHCASPFFTRCAKMSKASKPVDDKKISVDEWAKCLKVFMEPADIEAEEATAAQDQEEPVIDEEEEEVEEEEEDTPEVA